MRDEGWGADQAAKKATKGRQTAASALARHSVGGLVRLDIMKLSGS